MDPRTRPASSKSAPVLDSVDASLRRVAYAEQVLGRDVTTILMFDSASGFMKGLYKVGFDSEECETVFKAFSDAVNQRYPWLKPWKSKYNSSSLEFCGGVTIGKAGWMMSWKDPSQTASISIGLYPRTGEVEVAYEGPAFPAWAARQKAREAAQKF
jgi:hypothetical protein